MPTTLYDIRCSLASVHTLKSAEQRQITKIKETPPTLFLSAWKKKGSPLQIRVGLSRCIGWCVFWVCKTKLCTFYARQPIYRLTARRFRCLCFRTPTTRRSAPGRGSLQNPCAPIPSITRFPSIYPQKSVTFTVLWIIIMDSYFKNEKCI